MSGENINSDNTINFRQSECSFPVLFIYHIKVLLFVKEGKASYSKYLCIVLYVVLFEIKSLYWNLISYWFICLPILIPNGDSVYESGMLYSLSLSLKYFRFRRFTNYVQAYFNCETHSYKKYKHGFQHDMTTFMCWKKP